MVWAIFRARGRTRAEQARTEAATQWLYDKEERMTRKRERAKTNTKFDMGDRGSTVRSIVEEAATSFPRCECRELTD